MHAEALERGDAAVETAIGDLTEPGEADNAVGCAVDHWGGIDVLVNNAGWSVPGFIATDTDRDKWERSARGIFCRRIQPVSHRPGRAC